jgi:hypothetical protein
MVAQPYQVHLKNTKLDHALAVGEFYDIKLYLKRKEDEGEWKG